MVAIVPQNTWHRFHSPDGVSLVTATPKPTEHLTVDIEDPRTLTDAERVGQYRREVALMYFDRRLWQLTRGLRGRILLAIVIGLAASALGIARFALLGVLLARVFTGAGFAPIAATAAIGVALGGAAARPARP